MNPEFDATSNLTRTRRWVVAYDVSDHSQRRYIHTLLKAHGTQVQLSVFECYLSKREQQKLRHQLRKSIADSDSIRWYPLCQWCESRVNWVGQGQAPQLEGFYIR